MRNVANNKFCFIFDNYVNSLGCFQRELRRFDKNQKYSFYEISTGKCYEKHGIFSISVLFGRAVTRKTTFSFFSNTANCLHRGHENIFFYEKTVFTFFMFFFERYCEKRTLSRFFKWEKSDF